MIPVVTHGLGREFPGVPQRHFDLGALRGHDQLAHAELHLIVDPAAVEGLW
jgi:hypothetical protein